MHLLSPTRCRKIVRDYPYIFMENTWLFSVETKEASKHPTKYQQRKHNYVQKPPKKKPKRATFHR